MTQASLLYWACSEIFADYPLAVDDCDEDFRSVVLLLRDDDDADFYILSRDSNEDSPCFLLRPWRAEGTVRISVDSDTYFPDTVERVVKCGVPIPRNGSLFGWKAEDTVTAIIAVYADDSVGFPQPSWAVMPLADVPEAHWPRFIGERFLGQWFWEQYRSRNIISLDALVAAVADTVFWVDTEEILGWDTCAVTRDVKSRTGYVLPQGRYVYHQALRMNKSVPSLRELLAGGGKIDLASRFQLRELSGS